MDLKEHTWSGGDQNRHPWELVRADFVLRAARAAVRDRAPARILDLGSGDLFIAERLARIFPGVLIEAIDPALAEACGVGDLELPNGSSVRCATGLAEPVGNPMGWDLVLLLDVLEHVPDDLGLVRGLVERPEFGPRTRLIITVPAYGSLFCSHDMLLEHLRRYSPARLESLIRAAGLVPLEAGQLFHLGVWFREIRAVGERLGVIPPLTRTEVSEWRGGPLLNRVTATLLSLDLELTRRANLNGLPLPGLSAYAVCGSA